MILKPTKQTNKNKKKRPVNINSNMLIQSKKAPNWSGGNYSLKNKEIKKRRREKKKEATAKPLR
jgi:hypothetical protein